MGRPPRCSCQCKNNREAVLSHCDGDWTAPGAGASSDVPDVIVYDTRTMEPVRWTGSGLPDASESRAFDVLSAVGIDNRANHYSADYYSVSKHNADLELEWAHADNSLPGGIETRNIPQVDESYNVYAIYAGDLRKWDKDGEEQWAVSASDLVADATAWGQGDFAIAQGFLYVTVWKLNELFQATEYLCKVNLSDGSAVWDLEILTNVGSNQFVYARATDQNGNVYLNTNVSPNLRAYDADGNELWTRDFEPSITQLTAQAYTFALCTSYDRSSLYAAGITSKTSNDTGNWVIKKIDLDGNDIWERALTDYLWPARMWTDCQDNLLVGCGKLENRLAVPFPAFRKYSPDGDLLGSALPLARCRFMDLSVGRYPLFIC